jgi:hypothetical protein
MGQAERARWRAACDESTGFKWLNTAERLVQIKQEGKLISLEAPNVGTLRGF